MPVFGKRIRRGLTLDLRDGFVNFTDSFAAPDGDLGGIDPTLTKQTFLGDFQAIAPKRRRLQFRQHIAGVIVFTVTAKTKQAREDHLRATTSAGRCCRPRALPTS